MTICSKDDLLRRCRQRGYTLEEVRPCIVAEHEDGTITVDETHPAYPHPRKGWGDHVADGLAAVGITKERVSKLVGRDCGCAKRQAALNAIGQKVTDFLRGTDGEKLDDQTH